MITIHPQYIKDTAGKNLVVLPAQEFEKMIEEIENFEDVRLYDEAKKNDTGERILFSDTPIRKFLVFCKKSLSSLLLIEFRFVY